MNHYPPWLERVRRQVTSAEARVRFRTGRAYAAANQFRRVNAARLAQVERQIAEADTRLEHNIGVIERNLANDAEGSAAARQEIAALVGEGLSAAEAIAIVAGSAVSAAWSYGDAKFESSTHGAKRHDQPITVYPSRDQGPQPAGAVPTVPITPGDVFVNPRDRQHPYQPRGVRAGEHS